MIKKKVKTKEPKSPIRIVVLQRGWVAIGRYAKDGDECLLTDGYVIRRWGTTMGLGELAENGPLSNTVLEPSKTIRFHRAGEVFTMDVEEAKWSAKF